MYYTYILKSQKNNSYYVGSSQNIETRLVQHNTGLNSSTKRYAPWTIVYTEMFFDLTSARKRELQIKTWKKRAAIEKLVQKSQTK